MSSRLRIRKKSPRIETPDISTAPAQGMFQSRPFVVQTHSAEKSQQQPDLKTALVRAERYGHHLGRMQPAGLKAPTVVQPKLGTRHSVESHKAKAPQMLQAKLSVGAPGDMYEQEADAVAAQVVDRINGSEERSPAQQPAQESAQSQSIQHRKKKKSSQPLGLNIQPLVQRESAEKNTDLRAKNPRVPIQLVDYNSPTNPDIVTTMSAAKIKDFGPYIWDSSVPRFQLDKTYSSWTIDDCVNKAIYEPEINSVPDEKGQKQGLITMRRRAAMKSVFGLTKGVSEEIVKVNDGKAPRNFSNLATEDGHSGGHSDERHILGKGVMTGHRQVALRAAFWKVNGIRMDLDAAGTASVFANEAAATTAVNNALNQDLVANWDSHRRTLAKGTQVKINAPVSVGCVAYTKHDPPPGSPYPDGKMPKYIDNSKAGDRELYRGDYVGAGQPKDPNAPNLTEQPLTTGGNVVYTKVYVIVDPSPKYPGGWAIYTAYPKP